MPQPWQDSTLQSPDPKSGALSIRPRGSLSLMYSNYSFIFAKQQPVLQRSVKQRLSSYAMNWLERKMLICCFDSSTWNSFSLWLQCFHFLLQSSNNHVFVPCAWVLCIVPKKTKRSILFLPAFEHREIPIWTFVHLVTWLPGWWLPCLSKSWKHFSRWRFHCSHYLVSLVGKCLEVKLIFRVLAKR